MERFLLVESREGNMEEVLFELGLDEWIGMVHARLFKGREQHGQSDQS